MMFYAKRVVKLEPSMEVIDIEVIDVIDVINDVIDLV